jgi:D-alanyl-D-alanine carboxypeptidase (penicillin-binding protein 5/6)
MFYCSTIIKKNIQEITMKNKILFLIITIILCIPNINASATEIPDNLKKQADEMQLDADAAIVMDAKTGEILFSKNINKQEYPASITKLMTVLLAFENCKLDDVVTFSHNAVYSIEPGSSNIGINENEKLTVDQCLYAILFRSANEVANGIGEHIDGNLDTFAKHMTERAKELGAKNTNFVNANGLHDKSHYTSAYDMALIAKEILKYPHFKEILATRNYEIPPTNLCNETRYLHNQTQLINPSSIFYYKDSEGGKTGYTDQARNTLVSYAKRGDTEIVCVVLHSSGYGEYYDTMKLFDYALNNFKTQKLCSAGDKCTTITLEKPPAENKKSFLFFNKNEPETTEEPKTVDLNFKDDVYATLLSSDKAENITAKKTIKDGLAQVHCGDICGSVVYEYKGTQLGKTDLLAACDAGIPAPAAKDDKSKSKAINILKIIAAIVLILIFIFGMYLFVGHIKYSRKKRLRQRRLRRYRESGYQNIYSLDRKKRKE